MHVETRRFLTCRRFGPFGPCCTGGLTPRRSPDSGISNAGRSKSTELKMDAFMTAAIAEAEAGLAEGGIPIGSVLVHDGKIIGRGHNRRVQRSSAILHGEMDALENAGRLPAAVYTQSVLYTTLSPCAMCSGAILLYRIPRVVIGENVTFMGEEELLRSRGVVLDVLQDPRCIEMMRQFILKQPRLWNEDIGV
jgi:creatinine deaminase